MSKVEVGESNKVIMNKTGKKPGDMSVVSGSEKSSDGVSGAMPWVYSDIVKDHFMNPRYFLMGDENAYAYDGKGVVGNPICGDQMMMLIRVDKKTDTIYDLRWKTYGCASAIASTSALAELAIGKTLDEAKAITAEEIEAYLGGLPKHKFHCSVLGQEALAGAILDYRGKNK